MPRKKPKSDDEKLPQITGSLGTGKKSTPASAMIAHFLDNPHAGELLLVDKPLPVKTRSNKRNK